jgi:hypothetical protein
VTFTIDEHWDITVTHGEKIGPKRWQAIAQAFRRDTMENVGGKFVDIGTTMNAADTAARKKAKHFVSLQGKPKDWKSRS